MITAPRKTLNTSTALGWRGLMLQTLLHPGGEFMSEPSEDHLLCLNIGMPLLIERGEDKGHTRRMQMAGGFAFVVPAGQPALWRHSEAVHHLHLYLSPNLLSQTAEQLGLGQSDTLAGLAPLPFHDPHIEQIAGLLRLEMEAEAPSGSLYAETLASALSVRLLQREHDLARLPILPSSPTKLRTELRRAVAYIQDNLASDLSLEAISREAGLSSYHFGRLFALAFGVPPHQYVIQARVDRAKVLLTQGRLPLGEVAHSVGFSDQSHFTRHFKRLVGTTPRVFIRESNRKIIL